TLQGTDGDGYTVLQVISDEPASPRQLQNRTPKDLETVCLKCLQKEPQKRYASALALAEDLGRFRAGEPIQARPVGNVERAIKWVRRRPVVAALAAAVVLVTAVGVTAFAWAFDQALVARDDAIKEKDKTALALIEARSAKGKADEEKQAADGARSQAELEKKKKGKELFRAESLLYINQIAEAHNHLQSHDLVRCRATLDECR